MHHRGILFAAKMFALAGLFLSSSLFSQEETKYARLQEIARESRQRAEAQKAEAVAWAQQRGIPVRQTLPDGSLVEIMRLLNGIPIFYKTDNSNAAITTRADRLWPGGGLGLSLTGSGYNKVGEWDGGAVLTTHQEFGGRVTVADGTASTHWHSTHVAGTIMAAGVVDTAKGMAYQAQLLSYDWNSDEAEMAQAGADGMELSNHSYGPISGWYGFSAWYGDTSVDQNECYYFGFYDMSAETWDKIAFNAPFYLIIKSAGNDRNDSAPSPPDTIHSHNGSGSYTDTHYDDGWDGGFDTIPFQGVAKNVLTLGAVDDVTSYTGPSSVVMSSFSGWGPADDGRIKPDIVANGVSLYSCSDASTTAYTWSSGTSMSSPNATGTLVLLQQHYQNTHGGNGMRAATLKALAIHTAREAGSNPGPDYSFGWGLLNADSAAQVISDDATRDGISEFTLSQGETFSRTVTATGSEPLKVTIVWTDPPGTPTSPQLDPSTAMLVNDLDLRIMDGATPNYPWKLDVLNPSNAATRSGENNVDNVEQVIIDSPSAQAYTIEVDHDGTLTNGSQRFSMIVTGIAAPASAPSCSAELLVPGDGASDVAAYTTLEWEGVPGAASYDVYFGTDNPPTNILNGSNQVGATYSASMSLNTTYYLKIVPRNASGTASGCTVWSFSTSSKYYAEDFEDTQQNWENATNDDIDWTLNSGTTPSSSTGPSGDHTTGSGKYVYIEASSPNYPSKTASLLTDTLDLSGLSTPTLEFWYHMYDAYNQYMGDLYVDVYSQGSWNSGVFSVSGNQGNQWHLGHIDLSPYKSGNQHIIRFRGVTGSNWPSDIAIDDIVIRSQAFQTIVAGNTSAHSFTNANTTVQFTVANSGDITLEAVQKNQDPGVVGSLPPGVWNISAERYWQMLLRSGTADGTYNISFDLAGMSGISDYSTLYLLKRSDSNSAWQIAGSNNYAGSGTVVEWTGISSGFSEFGIGGGGDNSLPVTLADFSALSYPDRIVLRWVTESEIENAMFLIEKSRDGEHFQRIGEMPGQGNSTVRHDYGYTDEDVILGQQYYYRLADRDYNGNITYHPTISVVAGEQMPTEFSLSPVYPNPFNPGTSFWVDVPMREGEPSKIRLAVYNILGQKVRDLHTGSLPVGRHEWYWDGRDNNGEPLASGTYLLKFNAGEYLKTRKMLLLR